MYIVIGVPYSEPNCPTEANSGEFFFQICSNTLLVVECFFQLAHPLEFGQLIKNGIFVDGVNISRGCIDI
jgi:hypothetical protein